MSKKKGNQTSNSKSSALSAVEECLQLAQLRMEKCDLKEAKETYLLALRQARKLGDLRLTMEAISGLLRLSGEALDEKSILRWEQMLDQLMQAHPKQIPPMTWYCKGAVARHRSEFLLAQRYFHRYIRAVRGDPKSDERAIAVGWVMLATILQQRGRLIRSQWLANELIKRYEPKNLRGVNGILYILQGTLYEKQKRFKDALQWFQKAYARFLEDHSWYYHLYVLYGYARLSRLQQNYSQAYWYLDLVDKATSAPEFRMLRREIQAEKSRLEQDAVDLLIDSRKGFIKIREGGPISLRKQYVLLHILEALSNAHRRSGNDKERGLSKAEIIEYVWNEPYRPEAHDNKLYYNINRLRKLIEPDIRKPQYLLNWKQGYRLAPGLRVQFIGGQTFNEVGGNQ